MKESTRLRCYILGLVLLFTSQAVVNHYQQRAISQMLLTQMRDTAHQAQISKDLAAVQRRLMFMERERSKRLNKVARQDDLNTSALRLGPRGRKKLFADRKVKHFLGF